MDENITTRAAEILAYFNKTPHDAKKNNQNPDQLPCSRRKSKALED